MNIVCFDYYTSYAKRVLLVLILDVVILMDSGCDSKNSDTTNLFNSVQSEEAPKKAEEFLVFPKQLINNLVETGYHKKNGAKSEKP